MYSFLMHIPLSFLLKIGHFYSSTEHEGPDPKEIPSDNQLSTIVDELMDSSDLNNDGLINYFEYISAQAKKDEDSKKCKTCGD